MADVILFPSYPHECPVEGTDPLLRVRQLIAPYRYRWTENDGRHHRLTVPSGFVHNGASVPRIVRSLIPPERLDRSAVGHDYVHHHCGALPYRAHEIWGPHGWYDALYNPEGRLRWSRKMGDQWMMARLKDDPYPPQRIRKVAVYAALRVGGWTAWRCEN